MLAESAAGELIASEIEIRSGRAESFAEAVALQRERRERVSSRWSIGWASRSAATGTHPWADYLDQRIIDTPHYNRLRQELGWVAQRNNTWSLHVHMGVRGADRAIAVCDWLRELLPLLLAVSANSPFLDRRDSGLHTVRTEIFTRTFPRCGIPSPFVDWRTYAEFVEPPGPNRDRGRVDPAVVERAAPPRVRDGRGADLRRADPRRRVVLGRGADRRLRRPGRDRLRRARSPGAPSRLLADREIEENLWRAIRHGMDGRLIDFRARGRGRGAGRRSSCCLPGTEPARSRLGLEVDLPERNGAQRAREALDAGASIEEIYRDCRGRDPAHLHRRQTGGLAPFAGRLRAVSPVPHIDSRAAKPSRRTELDRLPDRIRSSRRARLRGGSRRLRTSHHPAPARDVTGQRADAGNLGRRPGRRAGLPQSSVHDHRHCRGADRDPAVGSSRTTRPRSAS